MHIALMGTRGVPAHYGGFETAVEEVGRRLAAAGHEVDVYCRDGQPRSSCYAGMRLVHLPALHLKVAETLSHTALSVLHAQRRPPQVVVMFNAANAPLVPALRARGVPVAVHVDGLEWRRAKWAGAGRHYYLLAERLAVRYADALIADSSGIADYYARRYRAATTLIPYGAPPVTPGDDRLGEVGATRDAYHLVVARFEPENQVEVVCAGYVGSSAELPLLVVGSAPYAGAYTRQVTATVSGDPRVRLLGGVWDGQLLDQLYAGCRLYLHGHSVGGTNPSLLRAMGAGAPVAAYDVVFNREVAGDAADYWQGRADVTASVEKAEVDPEGARARGRRGQADVVARYDWDEVAAAYERLCRQLIGHRRR